MEFYQTLMGHQFFEGQVPQLTRELSRLADAMERNNEMLAAIARLNMRTTESTTTAVKEENNNDTDN